MADGRKSRLVVEFFIKPVQNKAKTAAEGRPIFEDTEYVRIRFPGDKHRVIEQPASSRTRIDRITGLRLSYAEQYPEHYEAFRKNVSYNGEGTPIDELPFLTKAKCFELKALEIRTAEALADLPDRLMGQLGMGGRQLVEQAKAYLLKAKDTAADTRLAAENVELRDRLTAMENQVKALISGSGASAPKAQEPQGGQEVSPFAEWDDTDIRNWIKDQGGENPGGRSSHETLVKMADEINAKLREDAEAA